MSQACQRILADCVHTSLFCCCSHSLTHTHSLVWFALLGYAGSRLPTVRRLYVQCCHHGSIPTHTVRADGWILAPMKQRIQARHTRPAVPARHASRSLTPSWYYQIAPTIFSLSSLSFLLRPRKQTVPWISRLRSGRAASPWPRTGRGEREAGWVNQGMASMLGLAGSGRPGGLGLASTA